MNDPDNSHGVFQHSTRFSMITMRHNSVTDYGAIQRYNQEGSAPAPGTTAAASKI
ncbi:MAG: hypothetical protein PHH85_12590 [Candidatus Methanoperedens sp.]|nr:hypothetical protein [Candidatus Methanoperedens sp.]